jgi:hypothetical protein
MSLFATDIMKLFADSRVTYLFVVFFFKYEHGNGTDYLKAHVFSVPYLQSSVTRLLS